LQILFGLVVVCLHAQHYQYDNFKIYSGNRYWDVTVSQSEYHTTPEDFMEYMSELDVEVLHNHSDRVLDILAKVLHNYRLRPYSSYVIVFDIYWCFVYIEKDKSIAITVYKDK